ncbi:MAG: cobalt ECF transporter T component CbiQ [Candidatus Competibacteraceae bacterium]|jgi:cobalt/nickel transport system permease protein|nr:cobalt ECF transporter T component CbiQ [Candidatus Competibacteraceae bacterium]
MIQGLDPRLRVIAAVGFAVIVVTGQDLLMLSTALLLTGLLALLARLPLKPTVKRVLAMDLFIVGLLGLLPFTVPGEPVFQLGGLSASQEGLYQAAAIALKANAVVLTLLALVGTLDGVTLGHALHHLNVPEKLVHLLLFTVRYIEVLQREYQRLRRAMIARAFVARSNWHTWRSLGYLFGMLLVRSLDRSERIVAAMKCRGFRGRYYLLDHFAMTRHDWSSALVFSVFLVGLLGLEWL